MARVSRTEARQRRQKRVRRLVRGTPERPRVCVYRSGKHIYVQLIDDTTGRTLVSASSLSRELAEKVPGRGGNKEGATMVGQALAEKALTAGYRKVVFDRNGFLYHGRVQALSEGARQGGLEF